MKMTLDLPQTLLEQAMSVTPAPRNKRKAVVNALREDAVKNAWQKIKKYRGAFPDFTLDLDTLRGRGAHTF